MSHHLILPVGEAEASWPTSPDGAPQWPPILLGIMMPALGLWFVMVCGKVDLARTLDILPGLQAKT